MFWLHLMGISNGPGDLAQQRWRSSGDWQRRVGGGTRGNFRPHSDYEKARLSSLSAKVVEVHCWCPPEIARQRYERRATQSAHHPAHVTPTLDSALLAEFDQPVGLGTVFTVDTTHPLALDELTGAILAAFSQPGT